MEKPALDGPYSKRSRAKARHYANAKEQRVLPPSVPLTCVNQQRRAQAGLPVLPADEPDS